jgi:hypothetical protein
MTETPRPFNFLGLVLKFKLKNANSNILVPITWYYQSILDSHNDETKANEYSRDSFFVYNHVS